MRRYLALFGANQVKIGFFEEFVSQPGKFIAEVLEFLGLDPRLRRPEMAHHVYNAFGVPRNFGAKWLMQNRWVRLHIAPKIPGSARRWLVDTFLIKTVEKPPMDLRARAYLRDIFAPDLQRLKLLLKRDLPFPSARISSDPKYKPIDASPDCCTAKPYFLVTHERKNLRGFTLIELLVVVGIIGVLAALLMPALNRAQGKAQGAVCLNNLKQLQLAWQMYAEDHRGTVPENRADRNTGVWRSSPNSWTGPSSAPFDKDASAIQQGTFYRFGYVRSVPTFRCPADDSAVRNRNGSSTELPRTRSYSMNGNFGGRSGEAQLVLDRENQSYDSAKIFVFIDEHEDSIDDAHFLTWPNPDERWVNMPADRHGRSGTLSFADGHVESWKWKWRKTFKKKESYWKEAENHADLADLRRLQSSTFQLSGNYRPQP